MLQFSPEALPAAGLLVETVSGTVATLLVSTGFVAGALRSLAVLRRSPAGRVEWATAVGFVAGLVLGAAVYAVDLVFG